MPVLATQSVEPTTNDLNEEQTSVQLKDVKDGKNNLSKKQIYFYLFKYIQIHRLMKNQEMKVKKKQMKLNNLIH